MTISQRRSGICDSGGSPRILPFLTGGNLCAYLVQRHFCGAISLGLLANLLHRVDRIISMYSRSFSRMQSGLEDSNRPSLVSKPPWGAPRAVFGLQTKATAVKGLIGTFCDEACCSGRVERTYAIPVEGVFQCMAAYHRVPLLICTEYRQSLELARSQVA